MSILIRLNIFKHSILALTLMLAKLLEEVEGFEDKLNEDSDEEI